MFRLAGRVDAAKTALNGEGYQPCGVRFLPSGAINDPRDADFANRVDQGVLKSAITQELQAQVVDFSCVDAAKGGGIRGGETVAGEAGGLPLDVETASRSAVPGNTVFLCERRTNTHWFYSADINCGTGRPAALSHLAIVPATARTAGR